MGRISVSRPDVERLILGCSRGGVVGGQGQGSKSEETGKGKGFGQGRTEREDGRGRWGRPHT